MRQRRPILAATVVVLLVVLLAVLAGRRRGSADLQVPTVVDRQLVYLVDGAATAASVSYLRADGTVGQDTNAKVPLTPVGSTVEGLPLTVRPGSPFSLVAQTLDGGSSISCTVTVDGTTVQTHVSYGPAAVVECAGTVP